jgi:4-amino-4-deoxy-L-arabinose transferase-like glycosyltransferase
MTETNTRESVADGAPSAHPAGAPESRPDKPEEPPAPKKPNGEGGSEAGPDSEKPATPRLVARGNPLRFARGGLTTLLASLVATALMGHPGQLRWGVPLGALFVAIASWGVMDLLGTFDDADDRVAASTTLNALARPLVAFVVVGFLFCAMLGFAASGAVFPQPVWGILVTLAFVATTVTLFELGEALGMWKAGEGIAGALDRPLWQREGFWVVVVAAALYFPFMGTYSLWDPWETHYGEVSREMLARDDWISLWWAQDGWFWSKPVLDMWMQAIAMATLGVHYQPDKMLVGDGRWPVMHPEWAVRVPVVLLTIVAMYLLYKGASKTFGRRAALLGSLVLATMPDWYFLAHQTMTDMPFVAPMTACMGLIMLGLRTPETLETRAYEVKVKGLRFRLTAWHLVFGSVLICVLPQILYLLSRNLEFLWRPGAHGFHPHWDEFRSGSGGGNCGLPGNEECHITQPASIPHVLNGSPDSFGNLLWRLFGGFEPAVQALFWAAVLGGLLYLSWGERRIRRLAYLGGWFFAAISTLGKGPAGFGLPVLVTLAYLAASRPSEDVLARLLRLVREIVEFEIIAGLLIVLAVALPWYVAMYVRHGPPFTDRLIFHDMFNRAFSHVHDTNEGDDTSFRFYVWQLGYALFPWTGLAPVGLLWWLRRKDDARADMSVLLCMWVVLAFALFSFMGTKFHHYIFPAVPPIAMLIGVVLDDMLGPGRLAKRGSMPLYVGGLALGSALMVLGVTRMQAGSFFGVKPDGRLADPSIAMGVLLVAIGAGVTVMIVRWLRSDAGASVSAVADAGAGSVASAVAGAGASSVASAGAGASSVASAGAGSVALAGAGSGLSVGAEDAEVRVEAESGEGAAHVSRMLAAGSVAGALLLIVVGRDLILKPDGSDQPGAIRLLQLFTYNYRRGWPEALDFSAVLAAFTVIAIVMSLALAVKAVRRHAVAAMCAFAFVWGLWGLDVYMQRTAQHWGQHEVIAAYYADRQSPAEQLVAYQMNWKGENFYTGNHVPAFVSTGSTFTTWLKKQKDAGVKVMYFITEHGRIGGLKSEVGAKAYREVTDKVLCNKFVLVRAEL